MERPDINKPFVGPGKHARIVARTQSLEEANKIAEHYQLQGFETQIIKKKQGSVALYEVYASKEPDIFQGKPVIR
jgi:hypothetical protein